MANSPLGHQSSWRVPAQLGTTWGSSAGLRIADLLQEQSICCHSWFPHWGDLSWHHPSHGWPSQWARLQATSSNLEAGFEFVQSLQIWIILWSGGIFTSGRDWPGSQASWHWPQLCSRPGGRFWKQIALSFSFPSCYIEMTTLVLFPTRKKLSITGQLLVSHWKEGVNHMQNLFTSKGFRNHSELCSELRPLSGIVSAIQGC